MVSEKEPIDLVFDAKYRQLREDFAENYFRGKGSVKIGQGARVNVGLFALAIGIRMNKRIPKGKWSDIKPISWTDLNRLQAEIGDFNILFESLEIKTDDTNTKTIIDEFVTGGFQIIEDYQLQDDGNFTELRELLPELFNK